MSSVIAKFKVEVIHEFEQNKSVELSAVISGSEENKSFSKYTPYGRVQITIDKETVASNYFEVGKEYYLNFTKAEDASNK